MIKNKNMNNKKKSTWRQILKSLTKAKEIEDEDEILMDDDYDGIHELDNDIPPWVLGGFYLTILIAIIYFVKTFFLGDYKQADEYAAEVKQGKAQVEAYKKAHPKLFNTKVVLLTDKADLEAGSKIFHANCTPCHAIDGGGGIGPNLTDDHWIFGGGIKHVFHTITNGGRPGKGMISWKAILKPKQREQVASYVLSLQGSSPAHPKAPQGDIIWKK